MVIRFSKFASKTQQTHVLLHIVWSCPQDLFPLHRDAVATSHTHRRTKNHTSTIVPPQSAFMSLIAILILILVVAGLMEYKDVIYTIILFYIILLWYCFIYCWGGACPNPCTRARPFLAYVHRAWIYFVNVHRAQRLVVHHAQKICLYVHRA